MTGYGTAIVCDSDNQLHEGERRLMRQLCPACRHDLGVIVVSGPHYKMLCAKCGRYVYFAKKEEVEGKRMEQKPLSNKNLMGVLFPQVANGNRPNWKGGVNIDGTEYVIVGWERTSARGKKYVSLKVEPPQAQTGDTEF